MAFQITVNVRFTKLSAADVCILQESSQATEIKPGVYEVNYQWESDILPSQGDIVFLNVGEERLPSPFVVLVRFFTPDIRRVSFLVEGQAGLLKSLSERQS